jgi:hypothetical protein
MDVYRTKIVADLGFLDMLDLRIRGRDPDETDGG